MNKRTQIIIWLIIFLAAGISLSVYAWEYKSIKSSRDSSIPSASPSPGQPGNPGDEAKSAISALASPSLGPRTSITISGFSISYQGDGKAKVPNIISGVTSGNCKLSLSSPSAKQLSFDGSVISAGTYNFCSFGAITGINENGTWSANITVMDNNFSQSSKTTFKVEE